MVHRAGWEGLAPENAGGVAVDFEQSVVDGWRRRKSVIDVKNAGFGRASTRTTSCRLPCSADVRSEKWSIPHWTRPCGATSVSRPGSSRGDCAAQVWSFSGRGPLRPFEHGGGTYCPTSKGLDAAPARGQRLGRPP